MDVRRQIRQARAPGKGVKSLMGPEVTLPDRAPGCSGGIMGIFPKKKMNSRSGRNAPSQPGFFCNSGINSLISGPCARPVRAFLSGKNSALPLRPVAALTAAVQSPQLAPV